MRFVSPKSSCFFVMTSNEFSLVRGAKGHDNEVLSVNTNTFEEE